MKMCLKTVKKQLNNNDKKGSILGWNTDVSNILQLL